MTSCLPFCLEYELDRWCLCFYVSKPCSKASQRFSGSVLTRWPESVSRDEYHEATPLSKANHASSDDYQFHLTLREKKHMRGNTEPEGCYNRCNMVVVFTVLLALHKSDRSSSSPSMSRPDLLVSTLKSSRRVGLRESAHMCRRALVVLNLSPLWVNICIYRNYCFV